MDLTGARIVLASSTQGSVLSGSAMGNIDADGKFLGGLILPGHGIMLRALESGTAGLRVPTGDVRPFPTNTSDALTSGGTYAIAGAVERMVERLSRQSGDAACLVSGGAAARAPQPGWWARLREALRPLALAAGPMLRAYSDWLATISWARFSLLAILFIAAMSILTDMPFFQVEGRATSKVRYVVRIDDSGAVSIQPEDRKATGRRSSSPPACTPAFRTRRSRQRIRCSPGTSRN